MFKRYCSVNHIEDEFNSVTLPRGSALLDKMKDKHFFIKLTLFLGFIVMSYYAYVDLNAIQDKLPLSAYLSKEMPLVESENQMSGQPSSHPVLVSSEFIDKASKNSPIKMEAKNIADQSKGRSQEEELDLSVREERILNQEGELNERMNQFKIESEYIKKMETALQSREKAIQSREAEVVKKEAQLEWILTGEKKLVKDVFKDEGSKK